MSETLVVVTGAAGLLGSWLLRTAPTDLRPVAVTHRRPVDGVDSVAVDLRDADAVRLAFGRVRPTLVIHAAYANDEASIVDATRNVVAAAGEVGAEVLYVSTDAVFSGDGLPRAEDALPDPIADYGRWKVAGEEAVRAGRSPWAIVRLPLVVSLDPPDAVVARIASEAREGRSTAWFDDETRQPAQADELAGALWAIATLAADERAGCWHLPGPEQITRYEIARRVADALALPEDAVEPSVTPPSAGRPRHLHLTDVRARSTIGWHPSPILTRT